MLHPTKYGINVSVEIVRDSETDTAHVHVHAPMYINKYWVLNHSYQSSAFTDSQILKDSDFVSVMYKHYK
jgi:hypothetical protein